MSDWIETYTGRRLSLTNPEPEEVSFSDISHGLSMICRFNGQCLRFYSVAQHSLLCADVARQLGWSKRIQLLCLLHDAGEAYISDLSRPVKSLITGYSKMERAIQDAIYRTLRVDAPNMTERIAIEEADNYLLAVEAEELMRDGGWADRHKWPALEVRIRKDIPGRFKLVFLQELMRLYKSLF